MRERLDLGGSMPNGSNRSDVARPLRPILLTVFSLAALVAALIFTGRLEEGGPLGYLARHREYLMVAEIIILGSLAIEGASRVLYYALRRGMTVENAAAVRIVARIIAYGVIVSTVVSVLTANATAAITTGAFAGMVAGYASQTVIGSAVAGTFLALARPIRVGDDVTVLGNSGRVVSINLMHTVLDTEDREIMIPSTSIVTTVLIRHKAS